MQFRQAHTYILQLLQEQLPPTLTYHNINHTQHIIDNASEIAGAEDIKSEDVTLLLTAALLHDTGFIKTVKGHEEISCRYARELLPRFDYTPEQIERICDIIMATQIPQQPKDKLAEILCDADLYYLGTNNYFDVANKLYQELKNQDASFSKQEWQQQQVNFLTSHTYFTEYADAKLSLKQADNLKQLKEKTSLKPPRVTYSDFKLADMLLIAIGVVIAAFALEGFLVPNGFLDGGITGISLLLHAVYNFNLAYTVLILNIPFIVMAWYSISVRFALKTLLCILLLSACVHFIPYPHVVSDKLLGSIFGGFFIGLGIGLAMRGGCAADGIEVLAVYTWKRSSFTVTEIVLAINIIIFSIAAFRFNIATSLYSMLTYFTASKTIDYVIEGIEAYTGVTIISGKSEIIKERLVNELGRGITVYKGERGYLPGKFHEHSDCDIIFTVITRLELRRLKNLVYDVDGKAFVFANTIKEASGGIIKARHVH